MRCSVDFSMTGAPSHAPPLLVPPLRFALVEEGIYRGAYPSLINLRFLQRLQLRTIVSLLPESPTPDLLNWCKTQGIRSHAERIAVFKDEVTLTQDRAAVILQLLVLPERQPVYIHCLDGVSVTGTLIMCLRKLQRWTTAALYAENARFAGLGSDALGNKPIAHISQFVEVRLTAPTAARPSERGPLLARNTLFVAPCS